MPHSPWDGVQEEEEEAVVGKGPEQRFMVTTTLGLQLGAFHWPLVALARELSTSL